MKKKLLALVCMLTCIFALSACGSEPTYTDFENRKLDNAKAAAADYVSYFAYNFCEGAPFSDFGLPLEELTMEEISQVVYAATSGALDVDGYAVKTGVESFKSALDTMGGILEVGDATASIDGNQIVVNVNVKGNEKDAVAEIVLSNDVFLKLESASLNPVAGMGELMKKAGLNTLIGMGTVFMVLVLISGIISAFAIIPKIQKAVADRKAAKTADVNNETEAPVSAPVETVDETDDLELVAVIAAAIAAAEGASSTDGFVVRSIRRRF